MGTKVCGLSLPTKSMFPLEHYCHVFPYMVFLFFSNFKQIFFSIIKARIYQIPLHYNLASCYGVSILYTQTDTHSHSRLTSNVLLKYLKIFFVSMSKGSLGLWKHQFFYGVHLPSNVRSRQNIYCHVTLSSLLWHF